MLNLVVSLGFKRLNPSPQTDQVKVKVKQSHYRSAKALSVPEV